MLHMNQSAVSRLVLLGPPRDDTAAKVRHYRLARLKLEGNEVRLHGDARFAHLKRVYD